MANYNVVRTDNMSATKDGTLLRSAKYFAGDAEAAIENGMVVKIGELLVGERELRKATAPAANTPLNEVALVASPEYLVDERMRNFSDFRNEAGDEIRCYKFHSGDTFGVTAGCFGGAAPVVGNVVELTAGTTFKAVATATADTTTVGKVIAIETEGSYTYYVVEVA